MSLITIDLFSNKLLNEDDDDSARRAWQFNDSAFFSHYNPLNEL